MGASHLTCCASKEKGPPKQPFSSSKGGGQKSPRPPRAMEPVPIRLAQCMLGNHDPQVKGPRHCLNFSRRFQGHRQACAIAQLASDILSASLDIVTVPQNSPPLRQFSCILRRASCGHPIFPAMRFPTVKALESPLPAFPARRRRTSARRKSQWHRRCSWWRALSSRAKSLWRTSQAIPIGRGPN